MRSNSCPRRRASRRLRIQFLIGHPTRDINAALQIFVAFALTISFLSFLSFSFLLKISVVLLFMITFVMNLSSFDVQAGHLTFKVSIHFEVQAGPAII
jgi:ABC-type multidrug transport system permease subunit